MVAEFGKTFWKLPGLKSEISSVGTHHFMADSFGDGLWLVTETA
jgi:hypothetical protein